MKKALKILLFIIGFPALLAFVAWKSVIVLQEGSTYSFWPYVGLILAGVIFLAYLITFIVTGKKSKKNAGNRKKVMRQVVALVLVSFIFTAGIWLVVDIPLPGILDSATSGTVTFDKLREDYGDQAEQNGLLIDNFVKWNYANGNLDNSESLDYWLEKGWSAPEVQELISVNFKSIDKNGYVTFRGPWINLADDDRLTIPVLVHLVLNQREFNEELDFILNYEMIPNLVQTDSNPDTFEERVPLTDEEKELLVKWSILDMQGTPMEIAIDLGSAANIVLPLLDRLSGVLTPLLYALNEAIADDALAGTPIYIGIDATEGTFAIKINSTVEARGMWDYKKSAWLNSNHLLFAVISLFPARQWLYIWGAIVIFSSLAIGALRLKEFGGKDEEEETKETPVSYEPDWAAIDAEATKDMSPYEKTYYYAQQARNRR